MRRLAKAPWKIVLVVEDDSDGKAIGQLAKASGIAARIDWLPAGGIGNIKRRGDKLIRLAADRIEKGLGCVAVLVDRDGNDARRDEPHKTIARHCREAGVIYAEAREAFEAWCLADEGICSWLGLKQPKNTDRIRDPKAKVSSAFLRLTKRKYRRRRASRQLVAKAVGVDASRSPSWRKALEHLRACGLEPPTREP